MNVFRNFLLIGGLYLLVGLVMGLYMGAAGDMSQASLHAHINLLGFTLMTVFACVYRLVPAMAGNWMATTHFWLHQIGTLVLVIMLYLLISGLIAEEAMFPIAPLAEVAVVIGAGLFVWNAFRNAM